ncbi:sensor histidine kinase [Paracoccus aestuariivivens]|uniref:histidine kinase n=1 Tax=Paracoccus aestuariivivens TaxID=1820333 RepID=A0A6L6JI36_9RHOB|nr:HAMP domain-containing sensor histidine kinase [Paracoccus aestuariivivens]MTH79794.1 sensor histidine kinase [Paracoccus aestuariivivens]
MRLTHGSIRWRLSLGAIIAIALALLAADLALSVMFNRQVTRLSYQELEAKSMALVAGFEGDQPPAPPEDVIGGDRRYLQPYSGLYWQIEIDGRTYRSQSLWDTVLPLDAVAPAGGKIQLSEGDGPDSQRLLILDRSIQVGSDRQPVRIAVAVSSALLDEAQDLFDRDLVPALLVLGGLLVLASIVQVGLGMRLFADVHRKVEALQDGRLARLGQDLPLEVRPLASAIDELLDDRDNRIKRARHRATDLAHTLKTPLQAMRGETARLRQTGQVEAANSIDEIADSIRASVDRELGRARIGADGVADPSEVVEKIVAVLRRTARGSEIAISTDVPSDLRVRIDSYDLTEAVGSIAENALRHARSRIRIAAIPQGSRLALKIEDDGPGVPAKQMDEITQRGRFLDSGGSGVGLSLAKEIIEAADGDLILENLSPGFRVTMLLGFGRTTSRPAPSGS